MKYFQPFQGTITQIEDFWIDESGENLGCNQLMLVENRDKFLINFVISPTTYFVDHTMVALGDNVTGFYDVNAPAPLIFPPQFGAVVMTKNVPYQNVTVDYFDSQLVSSDGALKLNISPSTRIRLENGQAFRGNITNRKLIVVYGATTRSIPAQTTPYEIIVMC